MAIAFDAKSKGNAAATNTITVAHTCTGSNLILIVNANMVEHEPHSFT